MEGILADGMLASLNLTKYFNLLTFLFTLVIIRNGLASLTQLFMFWFKTRTITGKLFFFVCFLLFSNFGSGGLFVERGLYQVSLFIYLFVLLFLYNTLLTFLIKWQVGCDGTDVLVVQPGYRLISIANKYQNLKFT